MGAHKGPRGTHKGPACINACMHACMHACSVFAKWYMRSLEPLVRPSVSATAVATFGFRRDASCDDVISVLGQTIRIAHQWGLTLFIGTLDVATAFDKINHHHLARILTARRMHPNLVRAILREISFMRCNITLPGASPSDRFKMQAGGKQGGVETPELFNLMVEYALDPSVVRWKLQGMGFHFGARDNHPLSHLVFADNIFIVARSAAEFATMAQEVTEAIYDIGFKWKPSSLECMVCGSRSQVPVHAPFVLAPEPLTFRIVESLVTLGVLLNQQAETMVSLEYRLCKAEALYWKNDQVFRGRGSVRSKLSAWTTGPASSAAFGACTLHLAKHLLIRLRS